MPKWAKIALIIVGTGIFFLTVAGFVGAKALKNTLDDLELEVENAKVDGEVFGMTSPLEGCLEESVNRCGQCEGFSLTCVPSVGAFLWACLEEATYDPAFCDDVPPSDDDEAIVEWGREVCAKYGQPDHESCPIAVAPTGAFCETQAQAL